ncbi:phosphatidylinositol 3-kinase [Calocera cornea HHB12733]|uniref:Serine/threonine-protein kinase TOR n=1 Tax=Calocera cornea HHB12733 TaxID=1353952 RepID=A0A165D2E8_9BASI|nr:phosphatidylinositol 3-kinase [Calocera cornea HHB12733]
MAAPDPSDPIFKQFQLMRAKDEKVRQAAGAELKAMVAASISELSPDAVGKFWNDRVMPRVFELIRSQQTHEVLAGIYATELMSEIPRDDKVEGERTLFRFWNYIRPMLPNNDPVIMVAAAHALGVIAEKGGANFADHFIPFEVPRAIEVLQPGQPESPRWVAVLVLKELARRIPAYFHMQVFQVLNNIWVLLRDTRVQVREAAAELLSACLDILRDRDRHLKDAAFMKLIAEATQGCQSSAVESIHGSLLAFRALFMSSDMCLRECYVDCMERVWRYRDHKDPLIRRTVVTLLPTMVFYDTQSFSTHFLYRVMGHLMVQLKRPAERGAAFLAIGHIAQGVTSEMKAFLDQIVAAIKDCLQQHGQKRYAPPEDSIFQCIGFLASAVGPNLTRLLHDILDLMFACGLSEALRQALEDIVKNIPPMLRIIQDRLLHLLSQALCGHPYRPPSVASSAHSTHNAPISREAPMGVPNKRDQDITLALVTLGSFDFTGHALSEFTRTCALPYIEDDDPKIRQAAALTCCHLFMRDPICHQTSVHAMRIISDVLDKLLAVGIADPDALTRQRVLGALDERFDRHLSQAENIRAIFIGLNDEVFSVRQISVKLVGRLANHNPACVMPPLRKAIIQLLTEMEYSAVTRDKEESARLLTLLIGATQRLIKPYAVPILKVLLPKVKDKSTTVVTQVLNCLSELAVVGGEDLNPHIKDIMELILTNLQDQSSFAKREAALRALGSFCSHTGYVIQPYLDYPQILPLLIRFLNETERRQDFRREVIKVMGILGALDPYKDKLSNKRMDDAIGHAAAPQNIFDLAWLMNTAGATSEEYFQTVAMNSLVNLLQDSSFSDRHTNVIESILAIYRTQGLKCVAFLPHIIPAFLAVIRSPAATAHEFYISELSKLIGIIKQHIRPFLTDVVALFGDLWNIDHPLPPLVSLVEALAKALEGEFKVHLPAILPKLLEALSAKSTDALTLQTNVLHAFYTFGSDIEEYMHLVLPAILRTCESTEARLPLRKSAIHTIGRLSQKVNFADHASRIVHALGRVLAGSNQELRMAVMDTLCALLFQLNSDFTVFLSMINKLVVRYNIRHANYEKLVTKLLNGEPLPPEFGAIESFDQDKVEASAPPETTSLAVNQQHLKQAWDVSQVSTGEDWMEWIRHLAVELLRESPSHALRACAGTASAHVTLARELFNAAFISCWGQLYDTYQEDFVRAIEVAITTPEAPPEIINILLGLCEFMEHDDRPLGISIRTLGREALRHHAYAKALHYKELEFIQEKEKESATSLIEDLINVNTKLQQPDAAWGTLVLAREEYGMAQQEEWYEKLGRWQEALEAYESKNLTDEESPEVAIGKMRCYHALGEWALLSDQVQSHWVDADFEERRQVAPLAAAAAWSQRHWDLMEDYISAMKVDTAERSFYRAILAIHRNQFGKAAQQINKTRDLLDAELTGLIRESYTRAYSTVVRVQMLSELEEIIEYKQLRDLDGELKGSMRATWTRRLRGCQPDVEVWQRILQVRSLVLTPADDVHTWVKFANLCRKSDRMQIAEKTLNSLLGQDEERPRPDGYKAPPDVIYAHLKYMWAEGGQRVETLNYLRDFAERMASDLGVPLNDDSRIANLISNPRTSKFTKLLARCHLKQGQWHIILDEGWKDSNAPGVLQSFYYATKFDPDWYKAWHTWALANFDVVVYADDPSTHAGEGIPTGVLVQHIIAATRGFFRSISLRQDNALQDTLRILTLWFKYGQQQDVNGAIAEGFTSVDIDTWLDVIPQIIARIQMPNPNIRRLINQLLSDLGKAHPQALVYPLAVASKSPSLARKNAALYVLDRMREHSKEVVDQALMVSKELVRVAILWHEQWFEALEEASKIYFGDKNPEGMIAHLEPLHELLDQGPETFRETSFVQSFGTELRQAREHCRRFRAYGDSADLNRAWDIYYVVWKKIQKSIPHLTTIELQYTSPELLKARDLKVAVPGTYRSGKEIIPIASFNMTLSVIASKQRPRRLSIKGADGQEYQYALKGHEDLRQDERVMQLFSLVNDLLAVDPQSFKRQLHIQRYAVIPLSPYSGLLGWVQNSDTMHVLIKEYREARQILLNIEQRLMLQMAPDYENLPLLQKVEVFEYALDNTTGQDLYRVLWLKSQNSEAWLERRSTYTRSLAVTSMVGHILGLGDRHPSNLLLDRKSGKMIHIDFGDCFEIAMHREKYPEKIPFRLTRMLTHAMEVSGIHGSYKHTCEITMQVLRDNKESLLALMEAFVYDPLISWRLQQDVDDRVMARAEGENAIVDTRPTGPGRRPKADENEIFNNIDGNPRVEGRNERAIAVFNRVQNKLLGQEFKEDVSLPVAVQVEKLIAQATSLENLCQCFMGWCAFW